MVDPSFFGRTIVIVCDGYLKDSIGEIVGPQLMSRADWGNEGHFAIFVSPYEIIAIIHDQSPNQNDAGQILHDIHVTSATKLKKINRYPYF